MRGEALTIACLATLVGAIAERMATGSEAVDVISDWNARQGRVHSLRLVAVGTGLYPRGTFTDRLGAGSERQTEFPAEDLSFDCQYTYLLDFDRSRARKESSFVMFNGSERTFAPIRAVHAYDGQSVQRFEPRELNPRMPEHAVNLYILQDQDASSVFEPMDYPVSFLAGSVPRERLPMSPVNLRIANREADFHRFAVANNGDRENVVLRSPPIRGKAGSYYEYWVDLAREAAVTRWVRYSGGEIWQQLDIQYLPSPDGWLTSGWRYQAFGDGRLKASYVMTVKSIDVNPVVMLSEFQIVAGPGMHVANYKTGEKYMVIGADGSGKRPRSEVLRELASPRRRVWCVWAVAAVVVLGAGAAAIRASRRS